MEKEVRLQKQDIENKDSHDVRNAPDQAAHVDAHDRCATIRLDCTDLRLQRRATERKGDATIGEPRVQTVNLLQLPHREESQED